MRVFCDKQASIDQRECVHRWIGRTRYIIAGFRWSSANVGGTGVRLVVVSMFASHLREELIVIILQYPHLRLQLPDVVGGGI